MAVRIVAGSYERLLYGVDAQVQDGVWSLQPVFIYPPHISCIKTLDIGGHLLASGSTDEIIKLYDIHKRVEVGSLLQHQGSITELNFYNSTHLLSSSEDGTICIWRTSDWECMKVLGGHKGAINSIAVHPSGKLALSTGKDKTLRMWNLLKGRSGFVKRLLLEGEQVRWSPSGSSFAVLTRTEIHIYPADTGEVSTTIKTTKRFTFLVYAEDDILVTGSEDAIISIRRLSTDTELCRIAAHPTRIRGLDVALYEGKQLLVSVSSDGLMCLWDLQACIATTSPSPLAQYNTGSRLTCVKAELMTTVNSSGKAKKQPLKKVNDIVEDVDDDDAVGENAQDKLEEKEKPSQSSSALSAPITKKKKNSSRSNKSELATSASKKRPAADDINGDHDASPIQLPESTKKQKRPVIRK